MHSNAALSGIRCSDRAPRLKALNTLTVLERLTLEKIAHRSCDKRQKKYEDLLISKQTSRLETLPIQ